LMLINPGFASSKSENQVVYAGHKINDLRNLILKRRLNTKIEIDGRVSVNDIEKYGNGDVDIFVAGSSCIDRNNISFCMGKLNLIRDKIIKNQR